MPRDAPRGRSLLAEAASRNSAIAQDQWGLDYLRGDGAPADDAKAVEWFRKAAGAGFPAGQYHLGWMLQRGRGIARDEPNAAKWMQAAAAGGWPEAQQAITEAYTSIGRELGALVVPVGDAWQRFLSKHDHPVLHDKDQSHPSLAGSYLAACVFLAALFKENPVGLASEVTGLEAKDLTLLQKTAWQAQKAFK